MAEAGIKRDTESVGQQAAAGREGTGDAVTFYDFSSRLLSFVIGTAAAFMKQLHIWGLYTDQSYQDRKSVV